MPFVRIYHLHSVRLTICRSCASRSLASLSQFSFGRDILSIILSDDRSVITLVAVVAVTLCLLRSSKSNTFGIFNDLHSEFGVAILVAENAKANVLKVAPSSSLVEIELTPSRI